MPEEKEIFAERNKFHLGFLRRIQKGILNSINLQNFQIM
jgi:hypothetical protein